MVLRYVLAMLFAIAAATLTAMLISPAVSGFAVNQFSFDSPDQVSNLEDIVFMLVNIVGLGIGWTIGWALGAAGSKKKTT